MYKARELEANGENWQLVGWIILCVRFVQGWIYWGGGSRRFIYAPSIIDPYSKEWLANKVQGAMPGALFDVSAIVNYLLHHFYFLYAAIIFFTLMEFLSGLGLLLGLFTRTAAMITVMLSFNLLLLFGWEGSTCIDEWTMAVCNLSMGLTLVLTGSPILSIDAWLMNRYPNLPQRSWFLLLNSGSWNFKTTKLTAGIFLLLTIIITVGTYSYYRGAVFSPFHGGPVSSKVYHVSLSDGQLSTNGAVKFKIYVDAGPTAVPNYIMRIELLDNTKNMIEIWAGTQLQTLPQNAILNSYPYNKVSVGTYGLVTPESAKAEISLPPTKTQTLPPGNYTLQLYSIDGGRWDLNLSL